MEAFPESKFLLPVKDPDEWYDAGAEPIFFVFGWEGVGGGGVSASVRFSPAAGKLQSGNPLLSTSIEPNPAFDPCRFWFIPSSELKILEASPLTLGQRPRRGPRPEHGP